MRHEARQVPSWLIFDVRQTMKSVDLNTLPYKHRFNGASLLISKANRLCGMSSAGSEKPNPNALVASLAHYDMALALLKPYDANYVTVVNWKCNVLRELRQYEEAVCWYREIVRISDETDGKAMRNATAKVAEEMIREYEGRANEPMIVGSGGEANFDEPPYCMYAEEFCALLAEQKFKKAHACMSPVLQESVTVEKLKDGWKKMTQGVKAEELQDELQQRMLDWPSRKADDIGWCYFSVSAEAFNEAVTVVVGRTPHHGYWITELEFGRP